MNERDYLLCLSCYVPFGPKRISLLKNYFGSYEDIWSLKTSDFLDVGISQKLASGFIKHRKQFEIVSYKDELKRRGISFVTLDDENYPRTLKGIDSAPVLLYVRGELKNEDDTAIAIVGTRKMTGYGREVSKKFAGEFSQMGVTVISGLAMGIDSAAHIGALDAGGRTIAVVARGLDKIYPTSNTNLAREIIKGDKGAIISEYPLGYPALKNNFASRNRIISGLSQAVIVVEGEKKSGTLLTASAAAEQGRSLFAVPGQITSPMSAAPHYLIQNGAKMVVCVEDVVEDLDLQLKVDAKKLQEVLPEDELEEKILEVLSNEEKHIDEIVRALEVDANEVSSKVTMMVLKGLIQDLGEDIYTRNSP